MTYPEYIDGKPPIVSLREYDSVAWAPSTCVDRKDGKYVIVVMQDPEKIVADLPQLDYKTLDELFQTAHADYAKQVHDGNVQKK